MYKKIVIKIGTNVITKDNGLLDIQRMKHIVAQIAQLKKDGVEVSMVSSGAMGAGRALVKLKNTKNEVAVRQTLAAVGQIPLMNTYVELFQEYNIAVAQVLATKDDFRDRHHYLNMKQCFDALSGEDVIPILNENDVVAVEEIMFTDNDELAGLVAAMRDVDALLILTGVDGVYDGDPNSEDATLLSEIDPDVIDATQFATNKTSSLGRGGMATKCGIAQKCASIGIATHIINGKKDNTIADLLSGKDVGTTILAKEKKMSAVKKWIAHSQGYEKGAIHVNDCAEDILLDESKATSILPVGIIKIEGQFEEGDIIKIKNEKGKPIGLGKAEYDSTVALERIGKKGEKVLVHYDYLVLNV